MLKQAANGNVIPLPKKVIRDISSGE